MRCALFVMVFAGCTSHKPASPPPAQPQAVREAPIDAPPAEPPPTVAAEPPAPSPGLPPPPPKPSLYEMLRDTEGNVPGLPGFAIKRKPDKTRCGGVQIVTKRAKKVAKDDEPLAAVYKLEFPTGLTFDPDPKNAKKKQASLKKFDTFLTELITVGGDARKFYEAKLTSAADASAKVGAAARMAQIYLRLASTLARAEIPLDVRSGDFIDEKVEAFCDTLVEKAAPLQALGEQAMGFCAEKSKAVAAGWWNEVCVAPAP